MPLSRYTAKFDDTVTLLISHLTALGIISGLNESESVRTILGLLVFSVDVWTKCVGYFKMLYVTYTEMARHYRASLRRGVAIAV